MNKLNVKMITLVAALVLSGCGNLDERADEVVGATQQRAEGYHDLWDNVTITYACERMSYYDFIRKYAQGDAVKAEELHKAMCPNRDN